MPPLRMPSSLTTLANRLPPTRQIHPVHHPHHHLLPNAPLFSPRTQPNSVRSSTTQSARKSLDPKVQRLPLRVRRKPHFVGAKQLKSAEKIRFRGPPPNAVSRVSQTGQPLQGQENSSGKSRRSGGHAASDLDPHIVKGQRRPTLPPSERPPGRAPRYGLAPLPVPKALTQPHDPPRDAAYSVQRTPSRNLPVYQLAKSGGNQRQTRIRKIGGRAEALAEELRSHLEPRPKSVVVNAVNGHVVVAGWYGEMCRQYLEERGF